MRVGEGLIKSFSRLGAGAPMSSEVADLDESIVRQYADHLLAKAGSVVRNWTVGGVVFGAVLGVIPALLEHNFIAHGAAGKFAVVLGAIAGGIAGRTLGEKRALDLRFQAQMSLRQLEVEHRLVARGPARGAPAAVAPPPVSAPVAPAPIVAPPSQVAPVVVAPPSVAPAPVAPPPLVASVPVVAPVQALPEPVPVAPPEPAPFVEPERVAEVVAPPPVTLAPVSLAPVPSEPSAPPLIAVAPVAAPEPQPEAAPAVPVPPITVAPPAGPRLVGDGPELPPFSADSAS
jgi:hypothetical protein